MCVSAQYDSYIMHTINLIILSFHTVSVCPFLIANILMSKFMVICRVPAVITVHANSFHSSSTTAKVFENHNRNDTSIEIRTCHTHKELDECVRLQQYVWKLNDFDTVPRRAFISTNRAGGIVLGAFESGVNQPTLMGFIWAFPGRCHEVAGGVHLRGEMVAVHPDAANRGIGQRLLWALRDYSVSQSISLLKGNFDPTDSKLAHFYMTRLGWIAREYTAAYYGQSSSPQRNKLPTDRLQMEWWIDSPYMQQQEDTNKKLSLCKLEPVAEVRLPVEIATWKLTEDPRAAKVQEDICKQLTEYFKQDLAIFGFRREPDGSGFYQLRPYTLIKDWK